MRTAVPEKIQKIIDDIDTQGNASLTRLNNNARTCST
jgi:hypothetical protein